MSTSFRSVVPVFTMVRKCLITSPALQGQKAPNGRPLYEASSRRGFVSDPNIENSATPAVTLAETVASTG